ncbi:MAG: hypothetical protein ACHQ50_10350 [Fimbriimonadales bacterium]
MRSLAWMLVLVTSPVWADDAAWTYVGGAGTFAHNTQIRMVSERVDIRLQDKRSHFRAVFVFRNEGPATTVTMAFPEEAHGDRDRNKGVIHEFFSSVDGKGVKVRRFRYPYDSMAGSEYRAVWLKKVPFARRQTRRVLVDYYADNGDIGDFVSNKYILETGATWKGKIRDCVINIDWSNFRGQSEPRIVFTSAGRGKEPEGSSILARRMTLHLRDFKPDFNVVMNWTNGATNFQTNGEMMDADGVGALRMSYVFGDSSDPKIAIRYVPEVFGADVSEEGVEPEVGDSFEAGSHEVRVLGDRTVEIDGKAVKLRRSGGIEDDYKCIYLRDLVRALGGKMRYSAKLDRLVIWVK